MHKKTFTPNRKKAFSLIELSIVIIIIGLLVAGVVGGASLVNNAQLRTIMNEARGYQTVVNAFYTKYNSLPGDYNNAIGTANPAASTSVGNLDGVLNYINAHATATTGRIENNVAWQQLKNDSFITDSFTPATTDIVSSASPALVAGTNAPASRSKNGTWTFDNITLTGTGTPNQNVIVLSAGVPAGASLGTAAVSLTALVVGGSGASATNNSQLTQTDAASIDVKMDDGIANLGKVSSLVQLTNNNCSSGTTYTLTSIYKACSLAFQVDPNS
ncbi:MAG: prepilin-type N-terminal cleavage/methylation protein [Rickettsiaceae bacterium]|jgi:prepilin-type N-terminal cleavage/methylation domain-containing protein|nr:prepilin-type N-terminal cleavage/methylation protein [Rickettsiaceae bacterium]